MGSGLDRALTVEEVHWPSGLQSQRTIGSQALARYSKYQENMDIVLSNKFRYAHISRRVFGGQGAYLLDQSDECIYISTIPNY